MSRLDPERVAFLLARIHIDANGCWRWTGNLNPAGYGRCNPAFTGGKTVKAHRLSYETFIGPIPAALTVDHLCCVRDCINPAHLEACSLKENSSRAAARLMAKRGPVDLATCANGHPCYACAKEEAPAHVLGRT